MDYDSTSEEFEEVQRFRNKLFDEFIGKLDYKIENIPALKDNVVKVLFENIYASSILTKLTVQDTQNIRNKKDLYKWYERKVVVNALALSLLSTSTFDVQKVNLLVDFLTDFEDQVWQTALISIVITLVHHQNKWARFDGLKKRLQTLQEIEKVQTGLTAIETIMRLKLYSESVFNPDIYKADFFQSPMNCFLPFYEGNPIFENALDSNSTSIDPDDFTVFINRLPFLASHKYSLCIGLKEGTVKQRKVNEGERKILRNFLYLAEAFNPYQNLICEYNNFFTYFPKSRLQEIFKNQFSITKTKLKDLILNKVNELELSADIFIQDEEYRGAITVLTSLIQIEQNNFSANYKLGICYVNLKTPDFSSALFHYERAIEQNPEHKQALLNRVTCLIMLKRFSHAEENLSELKSRFNNSKRVWYVEFIYYEELKNYDKLLESALTAEKSFPNEVKILKVIARAYEALELFERCLLYNLKAKDLATKENIVSILLNISSMYGFLGRYHEALEAALEAYGIDNKSSESIMFLGRAYLIGNFDVSLARKYLELSLSKSPSAMVYGNLGHLELCEGNRTKAILYYRKCLNEMKDVVEFKRRIELDQSFIKQYNINKDDYNEVCEETVRNFQSNL